jgi:amino acid transporter
LLRKLIRLIIGKELNPFDQQIFKHIALVSFFAWIGLGADGVSSSCYGPPEAYLALGSHTTLAVYISIATAITIFVLALSYNQVIELFPNGGGGYRIATRLLHPYAGLVSGAALLVDYALTITISVASGTDAIFSLIPDTYHRYHLYVSLSILVLLLILNLRGMKESIEFLLPIFLGFIITHVAIILYGFISHRQGFFPIFKRAIDDSIQLKQLIGWTPFIFLLLHAYSLGAGTYTGLEAISNNIRHLAEPRVRTGQWTMFYLATSLAFTACGLMLLYLLWDARSVPGQTLNAVVFANILGTSVSGKIFIFALLIFEAGLLFVAANTGFLAGPTTLGNMAVDDWVPSRFRHLSNRLVMQNGLLLFGVGSFLLLYLTNGNVRFLVILYSINVFITFSLSLLGLCVYWWHHPQKDSKWRSHFSFSVFGFVIIVSILLIMLLTKFLEGGWVTLLITSAVVITCLFIKRHYRFVNVKLKELDERLAPPLSKQKLKPLPVSPDKPTGVFFISNSRGIAMHTLLSALRLFPGHFYNFIFVSAGEVDIKSFQGSETLAKMRNQVEDNLNYFVDWCSQYGYAVEKYSVCDTYIIEALTECAKTIAAKYKDCTFFASKLIIEDEDWFSRLLDNQTSIILQRQIFSMGKQLIILPINLKT